MKLMFRNEMCGLSFLRVPVLYFSFLCLVIYASDVESLG